MSEISITDNSPEVIDKKEAAIRLFLEEAGLHLEGEAKLALEMSPYRIDTGLLRNSISYALDGEGAAIGSYSADKPDAQGKIGIGSYSGTTPAEPKGSAAVYIGTNVEYAPYVHEGTKRMAPNRFLANAINLNKDQLKDKLREKLENA